MNSFTYLFAGLVKTKEELLGSATTDDEEDDKICDLIDTFRYFTEKPSEESPFNQYALFAADSQTYLPARFLRIRLCYHQSTGSTVLRER